MDRKATKMSWGSRQHKELSKLYEANYSKMDEEIRGDMDGWVILALDIGSRTETIKTSVLLRLLYLFQSLLIEIP